MCWVSKITNCKHFCGFGSDWFRNENLKQAKVLRDNVIKDQEEKLRQYLKKIADLETDVLKLQGRLFEAPKVHRTADIQNTEIIYQPDPYVVERNKDLNEEVEYLTLQNQKLNLGLGNLKTEYDILESKYRELEDLYKNNPRTIFVPKIVEMVK